MRKHHELFRIAKEKFGTAKTRPQDDNPSFLEFRQFLNVTKEFTPYHTFSEQILNWQPNPVIFCPQDFTGNREVH